MKTTTIYKLTNARTLELLPKEYETKGLALAAADKMQTRLTKYIVTKHKKSTEYKKTSKEMADYYNEYPEMHPKHWKKGTHLTTIMRLLNKGIKTNL
jgi:hypothetical protein